MARAIRKPGPRGQDRAPVPGSWSGGGNRAFDWRYRPCANVNIHTAGDRNTPAASACPPAGASTTPPTPCPRCSPACWPCSPSSGCGRRRDRRPASSRSRAPVLAGRAISVVRRESLSATLSPVVHSIPEDDWVSAEAEALLDATPGLREDLRAAMDELHAGTLQTVDAATARARIEARIKSRGSS